MKKASILVPFLLIVSLVAGACGGAPSPSDVTKTFLEAMKSGDQQKASNMYDDYESLGGLFAEAEEGAADESGISAEVQAQFQKLANEFDYKIGQETIDGDKATVDVSITTYDFGAMMGSMMGEYVMEALTLAFSGLDEDELNQRTSELLNEKMKTGLDGLKEKNHTASGTIELTKGEKGWEISGLSEEFEDAMMGGLLSSLEGVGDGWFGDSSENETQPADEPLAPEMNEAEISPAKDASGGASAEAEAAAQEATAAEAAAAEAAAAVAAAEEAAAEAAAQEAAGQEAAAEAATQDAAAAEAAAQEAAAQEAAAAEAAAAEAATQDAAAAAAEAATQEPATAAEPGKAEPGKAALGGYQLEAFTPIDNDECAITIKGISEDRIWGTTIDVGLENKSADKTYMFSTDDVIINGVQIDGYFATEVGPGKKANGSISLGLSDTSLKENGITEYTDMVIFFRVYDTNDWMADAVVEEPVRIFPYGEENATTFVRQPADSDVVLVDNEYVTAIATGAYTEEIWGYSVGLYLVNKSDKDIMFSIDDASVNGYMADPYFARTVRAGANMFTSADWMNSTLQENEITEVENIEFTIRARDHNDWRADDYASEKVTLTPGA